MSNTTVNTYDARHSSKPSIHKLRLQSAVAMLVKDYSRDLITHSNEYTQRRARRILLADASSLDVGLEEKDTITWGVSYISLKVNRALKLKFCIRIKDSFIDEPECTHLNFFRCIIWTIGDVLIFRLSNSDGQLIREFEFYNDIIAGVFQPVVLEIKQQLRHWQIRDQVRLLKNVQCDAAFEQVKDDKASIDAYDENSQY